MERRIPIEWLKEWATITDNEELMEVLIGDWTTDWFEKRVSHSKDVSIRDDIILREYNNDVQFSQTDRRHYDVELYAWDYDDEGNNPYRTVLYEAIVHNTKDELEKFAREQVVNKIGDHNSVSFHAKPMGFTVAECFHNRYIADELQKNTKVSESGQIGFKL